LGAIKDINEIFLFTRTVPNALTPSDLMGGGAAGEDDIGADVSSIDPNVTTGPCFMAAAPTLPRGILTPSLMGTPRPRALGSREWV
jgi:hypothetical protein